MKKHELKSKYDLPIEVDGIEYNITVTNANKAQTQELEEVVEKNRGLYTQRDSIQAELTESEEEFEINKHILAHGTVFNKVEVMFEQKALNKKIFKLKKELALLDKDLISINEALENVFKKRFELLVMGEDKATLSKELESKSIPYQMLFESIEKLIKAAAEKK